MSKSARVSPTAYATGHFWVRHGLSDDRLSTPQGRLLDGGFQAFTRLTQRLGGGSLEALMLARHAGIDARLDHAIETLGITQVIELAAGLSGRGRRYQQRYGNALTYVETDLPHMATLKQDLLERDGPLPPHHQVRTVNVLTDQGPGSLAALADELDPTRGLVIITEGLMNYLPPTAADRAWAHIATTLGRFRSGVYLADVYLLGHNRSLAMATFGLMLSAFVRGRLHLHLRSEPHARARLGRLGFTEVEVLSPGNLPGAEAAANTPGGDRVRILEARNAAAPRRKRPAATSRRTRAR